MKSVYYVLVFVGIYKGIKCIVVIVIEFDKFQEMVYFQGGGELLWVVGCYDIDYEQR